MKPLTETVKKQLRLIIQPGDVCIDATAGNGNDTLFLAEQVGQDGHVYAFDIQESAIKNTRLLLEQNQQLKQVNLLLKSHEYLIECLPENAKAKINLIMFNLGYLPGSDKSCITRTTSTLKALEQSVQLINLNNKGGVISIMLYPNHDGGREETQAVYEWAERLPSGFEKEIITTPGPQWLKIQKL